MYIPAYPHRLTGTKISAKYANYFLRKSGLERVELTFVINM